GVGRAVNRRQHRRCALDVPRDLCVGTHLVLGCTRGCPEAVRLGRALTASSPRPARSFNLDFRPATYWPESPGTRVLLARIKGTARRRTARQAMTAGQDALPEMFQPALSDENRAAWGKMNPSYMGGEYRPDPLPREVE